MKCEKCGKLLVDIKKKIITSCEHYPLTIGKNPTEITLGNEENQFGVISQRDLDSTFYTFINKIKTGELP